ncbi:EMILIN-3 [Pelobates cultripes]|uniref:EMILIN-3 n=1 Tax=Pelobates cultripes TaxID=61616 RepID=A0AAD1S3R7_PELCU|nr:EMILIN-3 [Pelobates cultripes]
MMKGGYCSLLILVCLLQWLGGHLWSVGAKGTYYPPPPAGRFIHSLYTSNSHPQPQGKPIGKHRNYCMYVVEKNITCTMQDGTEPYIKAEYLKCSWGPKCPGTVVYRTLFRPKYKIGYKVVTEMQWRCCAGHSGDSCQDGFPPQSGFMPPYMGPKAAPNQRLFPPPKSPPQYSKPQEETFPDVPTQTKKSGYGRKLSPVFGERLERVEEEVRRLSQSYESLQGVVNSLGDSLRLTIQEDTSKMIGSLVSGPSSSSHSSVGFGVISDTLAEAPHVTGDLSGRVAEVSEILRSKTELLEEVNGMVMGHEAQLQHLLEAARPSPLTSTELLEQYLEGKLAESRAQLLDGLEARLQKIQGACDVKVEAARKECQDGDYASGQKMQQEMDGREVKMREEMSELNARVQGLSAPEGCCGRLDDLSRRVDELERGMHQLTEEHHALSQRFDMELTRLVMEPQISVRLEEVEGRLNLTEEGIMRCCQEGGEKSEILTELDGVRVSVDDKLRILEERLLTAVGELSNASTPFSVDGAVMPLLEAQLIGLKKEGMEGLAGLENRIAAVEDLCAAGCSIPNGDSLLEIHSDLAKCQEQNQDLRSQMGHLNNTIVGIKRQLQRQQEEALQGEITLLQVNLRNVGRSLHGLEETVTRYADTVIQVNSTAEERGSRLNEEIHVIHNQVEGQSSQIRSGRAQLLGLRGDMERMKARLAGQLGSCQHVARELQGEVAQFERRVSQVESTCGGQEETLFSYLDHVNSTLAAHEHGLIALRHDLGKITQDVSNFQPSPSTQSTSGRK